MYRYTQINSDGYVVSDSYLSNEVKADNMISISEDFDLTNKRYINGKWEEYTPEPVPEVLTEEQEALYQTQINTEEILCLMELQ